MYKVGIEENGIAVINVVTGAIHSYWISRKNAEEVARDLNRAINKMGKSI